MQTRLQSLRESLSNTGIAFGLSWASHIWVIMPFLDAYFPDNRDSYAAAFFVTLYYTFLSIGRNYGIRRWHNNKTTLTQANADRFPIIPPPPDDVN